MKLTMAAKGGLNQKSGGTGNLQHQFATAGFAQKNSEYLHHQRATQANRLIQGQPASQDRAYLTNVQEQRAHSSLAFQNAVAQGDSTGGTKIVNKSNDPSNVSSGPHVTGITSTQQHHSNSQDFLRDQRQKSIAEAPIFNNDAAQRAHRSSRTKLNEQRASNQRVSHFRDKKAGHAKTTLGQQAGSK